jgi:hypothetical protein
MVKYPFYSTWQVNDTESVDGAWYFAADDANQFDFPTSFGSSRYNIDHLPLDGIGEKWVAHPPPNYGTLPAWLKGDHICGTKEQWQNGYPPGTPTSPIGPDGVTVCCGEPGAAFTRGYDEGFDS